MWRARYKGRYKKVPRSDPRMTLSAVSVESTAWEAGSLRGQYLLYAGNGSERREAEAQQVH